MNSNKNFEQFRQTEQFDLPKNIEETENQNTTPEWFVAEITLGYNVNNTSNNFKIARYASQRNDEIHEDRAWNKAFIITSAAATILSEAIALQEPSAMAITSTMTLGIITTYLFTPHSKRTKKLTELDDLIDETICQNEQEDLQEILDHDYYDKEEGYSVKMKIK